MRLLMELFQGKRGAPQEPRCTVASRARDSDGGGEPSHITAPPLGTAARFGARVVFSAGALPASGRRPLFALLLGFLSLTAGGGWFYARLASADAPPLESKHAPLPALPSPAGAEPAPAPLPKRHRPRPPDDVAAAEVARRLELLPLPEESSFQVKRHAVPPPDPRLSAAWMALLHGDPVAAIGGYEEVLAEAPENRQALLGLAAIEARKGEAAQARRAYLRLLQRDPADPLALAGLLELEPAGDSTARERRLKQLIARHPDIAPLHSAIGNLYAGEERWLDAKRAYEQALSIEHRAGLNDAETNFNLAVALDHLGKKNEARARYEDALNGAREGKPAFDSGAAEARVRALSEI